MRQPEGTSPYETFELFSRTPLPPDLAKTRRFQREPETTKFVRQVVDDTVPFSPFDGAELAIMPPLSASPAGTPPTGTRAIDRQPEDRQPEDRRAEDDSIEIVIVDSGEIERVASLELDAAASMEVVQAELGASVSVELSGSALEPLESAFVLPVAIAQGSQIAVPRAAAAAPASRSSWRVAATIALVLASAFAAGLGVVFALS